MLNPETSENNHEEEEEFEDAQENNEEEEDIWGDTKLSDFDYLKGIMQSEYGNNEFSNSARVDEDGGYDLNISKDDPDYELYRRRTNYILLSRILPQLERANLPILSYDVLDASGIIREIKPRLSPKTSNFLGFDYKRNTFKSFKKIIVLKEKGPGLQCTLDKTLQDVVMDFRGRLADARRNEMGWVSRGTKDRQ